MRTDGQLACKPFKIPSFFFVVTSAVSPCVPFCVVFLPEHASALSNIHSYWPCMQAESVMRALRLLNGFKIGQYNELLLKVDSKTQVSLVTRMPMPRTLVTCRAFGMV